ncbi:hypothetical protein SAMN04489729_6156 [Amycolatopsis lurida]|uniref:Uncharacterized protein n=1 Tax=Amycolatopsis lurida NRRL 2430 TaxID=1460371 RepID=A0A2P2G176_AMYLU|nr:hypothetical protein [Amycolatopsis lurida]KFU82730.1 hypothetical protein BB31_03270 [Amycolatopsis lurida NRRL 2430]SEE04681.1 hypothetical protein SAMN04489729_6156 [Amycolatopsis lurida]
MAVISVPGQAPLRLRKHTMRELCTRANTLLTADADKYVLDQATALESLYFDTLPGDQRKRIAAALMSAADAYRAELLALPEEDADERSRAEVLGELSLSLQELATTA